jgi:beta-glucanase (GH16 family)
MHGRATRSITGFAVSALAIAALAFGGVLVAGPSSADAATARTGPALRSAGPRPRGVPGAWRLRFSDEFRGSRLNTHKWQPGWFGSGITPPVNAYEQQCYARAQVHVTGSTLNLTATARPCRVRGRRYAFRSGMVTTRRSFAFTYGVMEARIFLPGARGRIVNWPAFWGDGIGAWPGSGENDVMEGLSGQAASHFISAAGQPGFTPRGRFTGWHTYASDWEPGLVTYYYDGRRVGAITTGITGSPMFVILNYAISPLMGGPTSLGRTMKVDYVRVWR